jgi:membrane protease YdiL (CAAX protease family)
MRWQFCSSAASVTLYVFSYPDFEALFGRMVGVTSWMELLSDSRALGRAVLWGDFLCALALLPLLRGKRVRELLVGQWSVVRSVVTGIGLAIVLLIVNGLFTVWLRHPVPPGVGIGTDTVRALQGISESYGALALIASVGLITPIIEEFVFRGVFLRATSRHVGFWLAALAQAVVFVLWHEEVAAYPYLFALALVASWLAWRSGGLLAPIVLHVTNNIFAALAIIGVTRFVNATP